MGVCALISFNLVFQRYLEAGSVVLLKQHLDAEGFRLPVRLNGAGRSTGGGPLSRGHIYKILSNPIYVGRIGHKGQVHEGQHPPIVGRDIWEQVQQSSRSQAEQDAPSEGGRTGSA